jgi:hypothetical protein
VAASDRTKTTDLPAGAAPCSPSTRHRAYFALPKCSPPRILHEFPSQRFCRDATRHP